MSPAFWLTIRVGKKRFLIPLPLALLLFMLLEIVAILPAMVYALSRKDSLPLRLILGFYLSRLMLILMIYGGSFGVRVCDDNDRVQVAGRRKF